MEKQTPNKSWYLDHSSRGHLENSSKEAIWQRPKSTKKLAWELGTDGEECHQKGCALMAEFIAHDPK